MLAVVVVLAAVGGFVYLVTTPEDRARALEAATQHLQPLLAEAARCQVATAPFRATLRARTPWAPVTPAIISLNTAIFILMVFGEGALSAPQTLVRWGGSLGTQTTNGEWWRLMSTMFVHAGLLPLLATLAGLAQLGKMVERLVGSMAFACVYISAGILANLVRISDNPFGIHVGAASAIFGIYGLLLAIWAWGLVRGTGVRIPLMAFRSLAPTAAIFLLYSMATDGLTDSANLTGFAVGLAGGLALAKDVGERKPEGRPIALATAAAAAIVIYIAFPLRGIVDIRPQIAEVVAIEERTNDSYKAAVDRFRKGRIGAQALTDLINGTIMPELQSARVRVKSLDNVLLEHQPLVADAEEYLRLRETSWRLRAEALGRSSMRSLREADGVERASLEALERLRGRQRALAAANARSAGA